jgi:E3 ubiquitin-protein ligase DOA10
VSRIISGKILGQLLTSLLSFLLNIQGTTPVILEEKSTRAQLLTFKFSLSNTVHCMFEKISGQVGYEKQKYQKLMAQLVTAD